MSGRPRRSVTRMTLPEAERIVELDRSGALDRSDSSVERVVHEARVIVQRSAIWGSAPGNPSRRRAAWLFIASGAFIAVWIAGLLVPLMLGA